jgi:MFS transporter, NNP family, nitrate/nitrite transporter
VEPLSRRLAATLRLSITWEAAALYAVAYGGYVAFSVYLPAYLRTAYQLTAADAAIRVLTGSMGVVAFGAVLQSSPCR